MHKDSTTQAKQKKDEREEVLKDVSGNCAMVERSSM